jgi:hypothetical protein
MLEEEALTTDTITVWSWYDCHEMERIYAVLTDALGKPVYIDVYSEETATTVSVWIIGFLSCLSLSGRRYFASAPARA